MPSVCLVIDAKHTQLPVDLDAQESAPGISALGVYRTNLAVHLASPEIVSSRRSRNVPDRRSTAQAETPVLSLFS